MSSMDLIGAGVMIQACMAVTGVVGAGSAGSALVEAAGSSHRHERMGKIVEVAGKIGQIALATLSLGIFSLAFGVTPFVALGFGSVACLTPIVAALIKNAPKTGKGVKTFFDVMDKVVVVAAKVINIASCMICGTIVSSIFLGPRFGPAVSVLVAGGALVAANVLPAVVSRKD